MVDRQKQLRALPAVEKLKRGLLEADGGFQKVEEWVLTYCARNVLAEARRALSAGEEIDVAFGALLTRLKASVGTLIKPAPQPVINATGIVLHTNLGRAPLGGRAAAAVRTAMRSYHALEYDLAAGGRGDRYAAVAAQLRALTGAEDALAVNNNAAAVLLVVASLAAGKEVIVSRGELVEIGGGFRVPDVLRQSGAALREVGATNKTYLSDYEAAVRDETGAILKVHASNYRIVGFAAQPPLKDLAALARRRRLPLLYDLGSGLMTADSRWEGETAIRQCLEDGAAVAMFSGDKLLGGSQAGIIAGRRMYIDRIKAHPLLRAVRIDKLSLAALRGTLADLMYREKSNAATALFAQTEAQLRRRAAELSLKLAVLKKAGWEIRVSPLTAPVGGGAQPGRFFSSWGLTLKPRGLSAGELAGFLRQWATPVIARVRDGQLWLDMRCVTASNDVEIAAACLAAQREAKR